jgi:predicted DNA-binding protein with PD1-like motif
MKHFDPVKMGKAIIIELERGEQLIEGICKGLEECGIKSAIVGSAVGSVQKLVYHRPTDMGQSANDEVLTVNAPMEVGSLIGSVIDGQAHFHIVTNAPDGVYGGHVESGTEVMYLLEVVMIELADCDLERRVTPEKVKKLFKKNS